MMRKVAVIALAALVVMLIDARILRLRAESRDDASVIFYALEPATPLRIALGAARALKLAVRVRSSQSETRAPLGLLFRSAQELELGRESIEPQALAQGEKIAGARWSKAHWTRLVPPAGAAFLEIVSAQAGVAVRVSGGTSESARRDPDLTRMRLAANFLTHEEERRLAPLSWHALPAISETATVVLPATEAHAEPTDTGSSAPANDSSGSEPVDATHSLVVNVVGSGRAMLHVRGRGRFVVDLVSPSLQTSYETPANATLNVDIPEGPASLLVHAVDDGAGELGLALEGITRITRDPSTPNARVLRMGAGQRVSYALDSSAPLQVWAALLAAEPGQRLDWRLTRNGRELARGTLNLPATADRLAFLPELPERPSVGSSVHHVLLPEGADRLELSGTADVLVGVETLLERGADPMPRAPFPSAPSGTHWLAVPARAPRWLPLPEQGGSEGLQRVRLERTPRLAPALRVPRFEVDELVSLEPQAARAVEILEPSKRPPATPVTLLRAPGSAWVQVREASAHGPLTATCTTRALNGEIRLSVDSGLPVRAAVRDRSTDLRTVAQAGEHHISIEGVPAVCVLNVPPTRGLPLARRQAYELAPGRSLSFALITNGRAKKVFLAVYVAGEDAGELAIHVDGGLPRRRRGIAVQLTRPEQQRALELAETEVTRLPEGASTRRAYASVLLGDDLAPGRHVLNVSYRGKVRAWARAWTAGHRAQPERVSLWVSAEPFE